MIIISIDNNNLNNNENYGNNFNNNNISIINNIYQVYVYYIIYNSYLSCIQFMCIILDNILNNKRGVIIRCRDLLRCFIFYDGIIKCLLLDRIFAFIVASQTTFRLVYHDSLL